MTAIFIFVFKNNIHKKKKINKGKKNPKFFSLIQTLFLTLVYRLVCN